MQPSFDPSAAHFASRYLAAFAALPVAVQYGFAVVFGLVIGSFLTVVVHRLPVMLERAWRAEVDSAMPEASKPSADPYPERFNLAVPRSACPHCKHVLRAWENIPVISYLALRGRCSACGARVSPRYPLVELASGALAALSLYAYGPTWPALAAFGLCATLLTAGLIDYDTRYLPDVLTLPLLWAGLIVNFGEGGFATLHDAVTGAIVGYLFLWCVYWLFKLVRGARPSGSDRGRRGRGVRHRSDVAQAHAFRGAVAVRAVSRGGRRDHALRRHTALFFVGMIEGSNGCSALVSPAASAAAKARSPICSRRAACR
jgi:leader peptidase (prepilin peptidase)/N-methyltransferase